MTTSERLKTITAYVALLSSVVAIVLTVCNIIYFSYQREKLSIEIAESKPEISEYYVIISRSNLRKLLHPDEAPTDYKFYQYPIYRNSIARRATELELYGDWEINRLRALDENRDNYEVTRESFVVMLILENGGGRKAMDVSLELDENAFKERTEFLYLEGGINRDIFSPRNDLLTSQYKAQYKLGDISPGDGRLIALFESNIYVDCGDPKYPPEIESCDMANTLLTAEMGLIPAGESIFIPKRIKYRDSLSSVTFTDDIREILNVPLGASAFHLEGG